VNEKWQRAHPREKKKNILKNNNKGELGLGLSLLPIESGK
jgi:hypothetical protein